MTNLPTWAQEALARAEAATKGPWVRVDGPTSYDYATLHDADDMLVTHINKQHNARDANISFITRARMDVPRLCEVLAEALAALEPLAAFAQAYLDDAPDDQLITTVCLGAPTPEPQNWADITVGDARRAAEVTERMKK